MSRVAVYRTERELRSYRRKVKRQKEIRRNIILSLIGAVIFITFALTFYSFTSLANTDNKEISYKYFTSIQVNKGDTLWSIAEEYMDDTNYDTVKDYITEVMYINKLTDDALVCGQHLVFPYYSYEFR